MTTMTTKAFYAALAALDLKWTQDPHGHIRCANNDCPIIAVFRSLHPDTISINFHWAARADQLGLDHLDACEIMEAADGRRYGDQRYFLEQACGFAPAA